MDGGGLKCARGGEGGDSAIKNADVGDVDSKPGLDYRSTGEYEVEARTHWITLFSGEPP